MDNLNNHQTNHPNSHLRNNGKVNTHIQTLDTESTPAPYTEGYIHGRAAERSLENRSVDVEEKTTATRGLLLGVALTSLVGLTLGTVFFLNQQHEEPVPSIIVPSRQPSPEPQKETTIIERTTETIQQPPASPVEVQPEINLTVPNGQQPTAPTQQNTTPRSAPTQTQPQNQTSPTNPTTNPT
ncbi:MAG TPA: hypothetical protein DD379_01920, partial [Cyanobacteria bacterium UBA11162]|nr:hypothetical protein [Cyanobacteria bacterium UBA11162]